MTEQKTMWAISSGDYSDYRVTAVCESKEIAEAVAKKMNMLEGHKGYGEYGIEEMPVLDESVHRVMVHHMNVEIRDAGGTGTERQWKSPAWAFEEDAVEVAWRWVRAPMYNGKAGRLDVWGTNLERVRKVLGDQRAMLMADDAYRANVELKSTSA
ncbi:hypothetical protein SEA_ONEIAGILLIAN_77 [Microbacterium phage OneinaGillian]|uniref:Uncharacterized protein n=1 Tax=Microbacterium phage OneinaGillian TaxID=2301604 RepID=A0A385UKL4_9CAUD|nr:hypothetical protein HOU23_gp077 [Microbacterium phage OneinaGillian]AYB70187.1 hypothetical protein SEA_ONEIAGILLIAN_77 [Microbacterium phage OneinaGillian]